MTNNFSAELDEIDARLEAAIPTAAFKAMSHLHQVAVSKTPLETGNLREESYVETTAEGARVVYPGPYARYQHYELQLRHEVGQALYLEQPLVTETPTILDIVRSGIQKAIDG